MDDFERDLQRSLTTIRDETADSYPRTTWELRAEALDRIRRRRARRYVMTGAVAAAAVAATLYIAARPTDLDKTDEFPLTGTPSVTNIEDLLLPTGVTRVGDGPRDVSVGGRGRIWTANANSVTVLDPSGDVEDTYTLSSPPDDIAIAQGPVWVALPDEGAIVEVVPASGPGEPIPVFDGAVDEMELTVGEGVVWVVARGEALGVVDIATRQPSMVDLVAEPVDVAIDQAIAYVVSADGSVTPFDQSSRARLDVKPYSVPPSVNGDLTWAADALWYLTGEDGTITRFGRDGQAREISYEGIVLDVAIDPTVAWVLLGREDGTRWLQRIDRGSGQPQGEARPIEGAAIEGAIAHGYLWVTLEDRDEVARFPKG